MTKKRCGGCEIVQRHEHMNETGLRTGCGFCTGCGTVIRNGPYFTRRVRKHLSLSFHNHDAVEKLLQIGYRRFKGNQRFLAGATKWQGAQMLTTPSSN